MSEKIQRNWQGFKKGNLWDYIYSKYFGYRVKMEVYTNFVYPELSAMPCHKI